MSQPKYPDIEVKLSGENGNAYVIMGRVKRAMRKGGLSKEQIDEYIAESTSGDYNNLLNTVFRFVTVN